jgi:hypothetical protein
MERGQEKEPASRNPKIKNKDDDGDDDDDNEDSDFEEEEKNEVEVEEKEKKEGEEGEEEKEALPLTASSNRLWEMVQELALDDIEVASFKEHYDKVDQFHNGYIDLEDLTRFAGFCVDDFPDLLGYFVAMACPEAEDNLGRPLSESQPGEGGFFRGRSRLRRLTDPLRFGDFVRLLGVFCLMDTKHFVRLCFNFGDRERNGTILRNDIYRILYAIWPPACKGDRLTLKLAMKKYMTRENVGTRQEPYVSYKHWREMCKRFPRLILPLKKIQYAWSTLIMGVKWWDMKKWGLMKARKKIIKDMGLEARKKAAKVGREQESDKNSDDETDEEM